MPSMIVPQAMALKAMATSVKNLMMHFHVQLPLKKAVATNVNMHFMAEIATVKLFQDGTDHMCCQPTDIGHLQYQGCQR